MTKKKESKQTKRTSLSDKVIIAAVGFDNNAEAQQKLQTAFNKQAAEQGFVEKTAGVPSPWTQELPTEVGYYWITYYGRVVMVEVYFKERSNHLLVSNKWIGPEPLERFVSDRPDTWWSQIIQPPMPQSITTKKTK